MATKRSVSVIEFGAELGREHFGRVVEGTQSPHGSVAVKVIDCAIAKQRLGNLSWEKLRKHLFEEAEALRRAEHEHVVRVHGVQHSTKRDEVFIVTERCDESLGALCKNGPVPLALAASAITDSLIGLEALHVRGMIHRDLKPSNVLRRGTTFKLADFGLVTNELVKGYASRQGYTEHLAPETFEVDVTSPASDVWAMGMTIFRVLNGEPWYDEVLRLAAVDREDPVAAAVRVEELVTSGSFAQKLRWMPHVPASWRRFVNRALHHDTSRRYRTGSQMLSGLHSTKLPHGPSWECAYEVDLVRWRRQRGERDEVVEWSRHSHNRHAFSAYTEAHDGSGGKRTLAKAVASRSAVLRGLQDFFASRSE